MSFGVDNLRFTYGSVAIGDLKVQCEEDRAFPSGKRVVGLDLGGRLVEPTERFWESLYKRLEIGAAVFRYYDYDEFFFRVAERSSQNRDTLRYTIEEQEGRSPKLLAVCDPTQPQVEFPSLLELVERYDGEDLRYADGVLTSVHMPRMGNYDFEVAGDIHANRFMAECPVDGYGLPTFFPMLVRKNSGSGVVAKCRAFRSFVPLGRGSDNAVHSLARAFDGFNSDEGFAALRQRLDSAAVTKSSVREVHGAYKLILKGLNEGVLGHRRLTVGGEEWRSVVGEMPAADVNNPAFSPLLKRFNEFTGDITSKYSVANFDGITVKRQSSLPADVRMYDLITFMTELASHYCIPKGSVLLHKWVGQQISSEYDLEGLGLNPTGR